MGDQPLQCQWPVGHRHYRSVPGGGGGCCFSVPARWTPGMTVRVDWETGVGDTEGSPGFGNDEKYLAWVKKMKAQNRQHSKTVPLPDYNGQDVCGITVHFYPAMT
ncbi:DUF3304 domain-containing protein [Klebsiella pneumoniae]|nr:DUF3304 domain-containing protein [Klebsiella pneumoniae]